MFVNKDQVEWQRFRFALFDVNGDGRITEESLFKLVRLTSMRPLSLPLEPTNLLGKYDTEPDIFVEVFANDFFRVLRALTAKQTQVRRQGTILVKREGGEKTLLGRDKRRMSNLHKLKTFKPKLQRG
jgi:hypothetical protein